MDARPEREERDVDPQILSAFTLTWEDFPHTALLLRPDRSILAANRLARQRGAGPERRCYQLSGRTAVCEHCQADLALSEEAARRWEGQSRDKFFTAAWIPLAGQDGLYIHFAVDITAWVKPELLKPWL